LKIKVSVKLVLHNDFYSEELRYKIKYKIGEQRFYSRLNKCIVSSLVDNCDKYMERLYYFTRRENVIKTSKILIEKSIIENIKLTDKHSQILDDIKNINKEKIEFEFEVK